MTDRLILSPYLRNRGRRVRRTILHEFPFDDAEFSFVDEVKRRIRLPENDFTVTDLNVEELPSEVRVDCRCRTPSGRFVKIDMTFNGIAERYLVSPVAASISTAIAQEARTT